MRHAALESRDPDHEAYRRAAAQDYSRGVATQMHVDTLKRILADNKTLSSRWTKLSPPPPAEDPDLS
jgi:hypothetical protein